MPSSTDTQTIPLDEKPASGYAKVPLWRFPTGGVNLGDEPDSSGEIESGDFPDTAEDQSLPHGRYLTPASSPPSLVELLAQTAAQCSERVRVAASGVLIDWAALTFQDQRTGHINVQAIMQLAIHQERVSVSVSRRLRMGRHQVATSSLLSPSGAYLNWIELMRDDSDGNG